MHQIPKDTRVVVLKGSQVLDANGATRALTASSAGTIAEPPLAVFLGHAGAAAAGETAGAHRRVLRPGKMQHQIGVLTLLPTAELLVVG